MRLKEYLEKYGTPITVLARRSNVCVSTMHKIISGTVPGLKSAIGIEDATQGAVTCRDLLRPEGIAPPAQRKNLSKEKRANKHGDNEKKAK